MLVSHAIILGLTLLFMAGLVVAVNIVRENSADSISESLSQVACERAAIEIASLQHESSYTGSYSSYSTIELPRKIMEKIYFMSGSGNSIKLEDDTGMKFAECKSYVAVSGKAGGGIIKITMNVSQTSVAILGYGR